MSVAWASAGEVLKADDLLGVWWSPKKDAKIEMTRRGDAYYGRIVWVAPDKAWRRDNKNPNPGLRGRKLTELEIFHDLKFDGKETWDGGFVYDPKNGKTFHAFFKMKGPDILRAVGYVGLKIFCRSAWLERVK
jgi:uncharacterized protein (DUF2147 family)